MGRTKVSWIAICATVAVVGVLYYIKPMLEHPPLPKTQRRQVSFAGSEEAAKAQQFESWHESEGWHGPLGGSHAEYAAM